MTRWRWVILQFSRRLWVRASLFAVLGVLTALVSVVAEPLIPVDIPGKIGADAVDNILNILASSMLAVTTFSLSIMVASYGTATRNATPRATRLLIEDGTTQTVLSTFVGTFLFSLVGIVTLGAGAYGASGRVILFVVTLGVILVIVGTILRWIDHLSRFGRVGDTTRRVEEAVRSAMSHRMAHPFLGGQPLYADTGIPSGVHPLRSAGIGYVQHIDMPALSSICEANQAKLYIKAVPGSFVDRRRPLACLKFEGSVSRDDRDEDQIFSDLRAAFTVDDERSFDQDPRFGMSVLSEIASRALSPALNDMGTAIDVIGRAVRLLSIWSDSEQPEDGTDPEFPLIYVPPVGIRDVFDDIFTPIARDGAGLIEVQLRLQKAMMTLAGYGGEFETSARAHSSDAVERANHALTSMADRKRLAALVGRARGAW